MAEPTLVYLFGAPGVGKSTVMAVLTSLCDRVQASSGFPHEILISSEGRMVGAEMGRTRSSFSGTDALSMSIQPQAVSWVSTRPYGLILGEGSRLANAGFLEAARLAGYTVHPFYLAASPEALQERRKLRGSRQNEAWMKGAATRAENLALKLGLSPLDMGGSAAEAAAYIRSQVPALEALK